MSVERWILFKHQSKTSKFRGLFRQHFGTPPSQATFTYFSRYNKYILYFMTFYLLWHFTCYTLRFYHTFQHKAFEKNQLIPKNLPKWNQIPKNDNYFVFPFLKVFTKSYRNTNCYSCNLWKRRWTYKGVTSVAEKENTIQNPIISHAFRKLIQMTSQNY